MISFNVLGCCVSRDILNPLIERREAQVLQYPGFSSPLSMCSQEQGLTINAGDLSEYNVPNDFYRRSIALDISGKVLDYLFEKKSDYIILDVLDSRFSLLKKGNNFITALPPLLKNREKFNEEYGLDTYEELSPFDVEAKQWEEVMNLICEQMSKHYAPRQIILHKFFGIEKFVDKVDLRTFSKQTIDFVRRYNALAEKLNRILEKKLAGCHTIEFPKNTVSIAGHRWGLTPLHYHDIYYEYGAKATDLITHNLPDEQEKSKLSDLKAAYEEKFELLQTKYELKTVRDSLWGHKNALNFTNRLIWDLLADKKFICWLQQCSHNRSKIAVLKSQDIAGKILVKALEEYGIETVLTCTHASFDRMTEEQLEKCRQADIIISADVHSTSPVTNGELTAITQ